MVNKEIAFTSDEVIDALLTYAIKYRNTKWTNKKARWRKNADWSVIVTLNDD